MRTGFRTAAAAVAVLISASCTKQVVTDGVIFTASIDQDDTRTTLTRDYKVYWDISDQVNINGSVYAATPAQNPTNASFSYVSGSVPKLPYSAIFPASLYVAGHYEFPSTQSYTAGKFNAPMYAYSATSENLPFKNICGVLCFALKGIDRVRSISVTANEPICGEFTVNSQAVVSLAGSGKTVTLDCGAEGVQLNSATATNFYVYIPPRALYSAGMKFTVTTVGGTNNLEKTTLTAFTVSRNSLYTFNWTLGSVSPTPIVTLPGEFSVSDDNGTTVRRVRFSQGNLRYIPTADNKWSFFEKQYDFCNTDTFMGHHADTLSLFTWGYNPVKSSDLDGGDSNNVSRSSGDLSASEDWGYALGGAASPWRSLTANEWNYLLEGRNNADAKVGFATVGGSPGLVILPDSFTDPNRNNGSGAFKPKSSTGWGQNVYAAGADWDAMETAGAVFLPAAGHRDRFYVYNSGVTGHYWSSSAYGGTSARYLYFNSLSFSHKNEFRSLGYAVRLVTDVIGGGTESYQ